MLMRELPEKLKKNKFKEKISHDKDFTEEEDRVMLKEEEKVKARKRTRGPYRKSSKVGL